MADYLINDVALWVSKRPESALNTGYGADSDFLGIRTQQPAYVLPQIEFLNDAGIPGNGHEFATEWCANYVTHPAFTFTDDINFGIAGRLALRALGGSVTTAQQGGTTAYKHSCNMLPVASGRQLPSSTMAALLGGASFKLDGCVVDRFRLSQNRADRPQYSVDLIGSGDFTTPHGITGTLPSPVTPACLTGSGTEVKWTDLDGTTTFSGASCSMRSWFVEVQNNTKLNDRCPGDSTLTLTYDATTTTPGYVGKLRRGTRAVTAQIVILLDSTIVPWERYVTGQAITDVTFKAQSTVEAGTAYKYTVNYIIPKARIQAVTPGENDGDATMTIDLIGIWDSVSGGALKCEVINTETANYD